MSSGELREHLAPVFMDGAEYISWKIVPDYPTFENYGRLLFMTPQFFILFWNSIRMVGLILLGQLVVGVPAAWAFAVYQMKGSRALFAFYIVLMLLPFQVTMLSSYIVLNRLELLNTQKAVILPAVFDVYRRSCLRRHGLTEQGNGGFFARLAFPLVRAGCCQLWSWDFWNIGI